MNETMQALQQQIAEVRRHGPLKATVYLICPEPSCSVQEMEIVVREGRGRRAFQAPLRCVRCGREAQFEELEA